MAICRTAVLSAAVLTALNGFSFAEVAESNVRFRGSLSNSRIQFENQKKGHVAFIGGSITEMNGYRPMVCEILQRRFPETEFTFTAAGISSTCSTAGAFRLERDVLSKGPVDLFFVEYAVNDDQDAGHARENCIRGMEGIIRQTRRHNPNADIVITHFVNTGMIETIRGGGEPTSSGAHEEVAEHYGISTIHLAREVTQQIDSGKLTWQKFGGVHPAPFGNAICANMIDKLMSQAWKEPLHADAKPAAHELPAERLEEACYENGRFIDPQKAKVASGFAWKTPNWKELPGSCRKRFVEEKLLCGEAGNELTLEFEGRGVGAFVLAGRDAGTVTASVDGGESVDIDLYHHYSRGLHYPRTVMLADDLPPGKHVLRLTVSDTANPKSQGSAVRILQFTAN